MTLYSISQLSQFSGIKPHTIRMWEQRYNALKPIRSGGNTRYYDSTQLRRLLNIVSLLDMEFKVSELCSMPDEKLFKLVEEYSHNFEEHEPLEYYISQLIAAGMDYDEHHFEKILSHCFLKYGIQITYQRIIHPTVVRVGVYWTSNNIPPAQEHFITNLFRQKLSMGIDSLPPAEKEESWLLYLPEGEFHEIGLLYAHYLIKLSGRKVIYLGANLPLTSVIDAVKDTNVENLLFFMVHYDQPEQVSEYLDELYTEFKEKEIFLAGNNKLIDQLNLKENFRFLKDVEALEEILQVDKNKEEWQKSE